MLNKLMFSIFVFLSFTLNVKAGLYENISSLLEINQKNFKEQYKIIEEEKKTLDNFDNITLDQDYLSTVLFYTSKETLALGNRDECSFYDLILAGLLKDNLTEKISHVIVNKDNEKYIIDIKTYIDKVAIKKCPKVREFSKHFEPQNILNTLSKYTVSVPTTKEECFKVHADFLADYKSPYLCAINDKINNLTNLEFILRNTSKQKYKERTKLISKIKEAKSYQAKLNPNALSYISRLCNHATSQDLFCKEVFQDNFWSKIISKEKSSIYAAPFCKINTKRKGDFSRKEKSCILNLANRPEICEKASLNGSLTPILNCNTLSKTLNFSKLKSTYNDCPLVTQNSHITNIGRLLNHYKKSINKDPTSCIYTNSAALLEMLKEQELLSQWGLNLCFDDKIKREKICYPTLIGNNQENEFSMSQVVKRILVRTKGMVESLQCEMIAEDEYKPILLKYKTGCFILEPQTCDAIRCKPRIIFNELEVNTIEIQNGINVNYYASKFNEVQYSLSTMIAKHLKLKTKKIFNITALKAILDKPKGLIHGSGCIEDLLPSFHARTNFSQCNPINFIVDGYIEKDGYLSVSLRTSQDSLQYPRIISWSYLFNSVKNFQVFQPINEWSLDGLF